MPIPDYQSIMLPLLKYANNQQQHSMKQAYDDLAKEFGLTTEEKNEFDAFTCLRDHAWREFEEKTRTEWRLSFGIWAAILSSAGAILSSDQLKGSLGLMISACVAVIIVVVLHTTFLWWIQKCLKKSREILSDADTRMRALLHQDPVTFEKREDAWKQSSLQVQMLITLLVSITLLIVVCT